MAEVKHDAMTVRDGTLVEEIGPDGRKKTVGFGASLRETLREFTRTCNRVVRYQHVHLHQATARSMPR